MKFSKCAKHAFALVAHSKLRSWLTIIGIVIGVAAVISIMSIGDTLRSSVNQQFNALSGDVLTITPGFSRGANFLGQRSGPESTTSGAADTTPTLGLIDVQALRGSSDVMFMDTEIRGNVKATYLGQTGTVQMTGVDQKTWALITPRKIKEGRVLDSTDQNVIVIGGRLASSFFKQPLGVNKVISINNNTFRIVGIMDDETNNVYMPIARASQVIADKEKDKFDSIVVKIRNEADLDNSISRIESKLMLARHVTSRNKDFSISSSKLASQTRSDVQSSISNFLLAIAGVSLLVGAIGIANTMFTSVVEKTKEIGIMKAIGARNKDIMTIYLLNAVLIGAVGGTIGIIVGVLISGTVAGALGNIPFTRGSSFVSINATLIAFSVSITIGAIAGIIPAYNASKLKPVDALKYE